MLLVLDVLDFLSISGGLLKLLQYHGRSSGDDGGGGNTVDDAEAHHDLDALPQRIVSHLAKPDGQMRRRLNW